MHLESHHPLSLHSLFAGSGAQTRKLKVAGGGLRTPEVQLNMRRMLDKEDRRKS